MKSSLDLCPRDLHIVFGKNRAWQWQCLWPEWRLSLVRPVVTQSYICDFISPYITERMRFSRPILVFSAVFDKTGRSCSNSLPFFDGVVGWIYEQSFCRIDRTNKIRLHFRQVLLVFIVFCLVLNVILSDDLAWLGQRTANLWYPSPWLGSYLIFPCSHFSKQRPMPERALAASSSVRYRQSPGSLGWASRHASVVVLLHCHGDGFLQIWHKYSPRLVHTIPVHIIL